MREHILIKYFEIVISSFCVNASPQLVLWIPRLFVRLLMENRQRRILFRNIFIEIAIQLKRSDGKSRSNIMANYRQKMIAVPDDCIRVKKFYADSVDSSIGEWSVSTRYESRQFQMWSEHMVPGICVLSGQRDSI